MGLTYYVFLYETKKERERLLSNFTFLRRCIRNKPVTDPEDT
jgi:hypothetical protein